jgi:hypothetical protein
MKHSYFAAAAVLGATLAISTTANAQDVVGDNSRPTAFVGNFGGGFGSGFGGGRVELEFQYHMRGRQQGPGFGVGLLVPLWAGAGIGAQGRFMYDIQVIPNVAFLITPYVGLSAGFWNRWCGGGRDGYCGGGWIGPELGLELKLILLDRLLIGIRPVGLSLPIGLGYGNDWFWWGYHGAFIIGVTF